MGCSTHNHAWPESRLPLLPALLLVLGFALLSSAEDQTWLYAVQLSASVQLDPPQITLNWVPDTYGADSYVVYRKLMDENSWGPGISLPGWTTTFTDEQVAVGGAYEYQVVKNATLGYTGYGYIYAGINAPPIENRGKLVLIVAADTSSLASELDTLQSDLTGDGWVVIRHDVSAADSPASVKSLIVNDYYADPVQVQAVFLFGHVPIVMSGSLDYDSHGARPMPADAFYGDIDGNWQLELDPINRPSYMPSNIELMVGRVDFFNMPGIGAPSPWPSETELLRRYLNKDHAWRQKQFTVPRRALMANRVGDYYGQAYAASGYRNFQPFVGPGNIAEANVDDTAPQDQRWISLATGGAWLWTFGCGGGQDNVISQLGTHDTYNDVWSTDIVAQDAKVVFSMFFGSHFGDWTGTDNIMRAMLATPSMGLTACIVGLPHWFCHHMAMGEPIGYSARLTMNNTTLYQNQSNGLPRAVFINLLGDPTLRLEPVAPPSGLSTSANNGAIALSWSASPDPVVGYYVYCSASSSGPFTRLNDMPVTGTSFTDTSGSGGTYMVRAIGLQMNPSGSYYNPSQGIFAQANGTGWPPPPPPAVGVRVSAMLEPTGVQLTWASQSGSAYHVEAKDPIANSPWVDISGRIQAPGPTASFTDANWLPYATRWYRVVSE